VGAKAEIYQLLGQLSTQGMALVLVSSDLPELIAVCSRILVVWQGRITGDLSAGEIDEASIMRCATGTRAAAGGGG